MTDQPMAKVVVTYFDIMGMRCATCRHWDPTNKYARTEAPTDGAGVWGMCLMTVYGASHDGDDEYLHPESMALARDHEEYAAELMTRPDFGCVQWEARDATPDR